MSTKQSSKNRTGGPHSGQTSNNQSSFARNNTDKIHHNMRQNAASHMSANIPLPMTQPAPPNPLQQNSQTAANPGFRGNFSNSNQISQAPNSPMPHPHNPQVSMPRMGSRYPVPFMPNSAGLSAMPENFNPFNMQPGMGSYTQFNFQNYRPFSNNLNPILFPVVIDHPTLSGHAGLAFPVPNVSAPNPSVNNNEINNPLLYKQQSQPQSEHQQTQPQQPKQRTQRAKKIDGIYR